MNFEIMEAGWRPGVLGGYAGQTFSVGIRPTVASGRKAAAWVRISGAVHEERGVDYWSRVVLGALNDGFLELPARAAPGIQYRITPAGKAGGLRRAT